MAVNFRTFLAGAASLAATACAEPTSVDLPIAVDVVRRTPDLSAIASETVFDVEWASDSTLFASVDLGRQLVLLDWEGRTVRTVARRGQGPAEVMGAAWLLRRSDSVLVSIDILQPRITWWTMDGDRVAEEKPAVPAITGAWAVQSGIVVRSATPTSATYTWFDDEGRIQRKLDVSSVRDSPRESCSYCPAAMSASGTIAMAVSDTSYRFLRTHARDTLRAIERAGVARVRLSGAQRDSQEVRVREVEALMDRTKASARTRARFLSRTRAEFLPRFVARSVRFDDAERLWVQRNVPEGDSAAVDLFDADAAYVGTVRLPPGSVLHRAWRDRLLTSLSDSSDRTVLVEYRRR